MGQRLKRQILFDVVDYSLRSTNLLSQALEFATQFTYISEQDVDIIMHGRKSSLFHDKKPWCKKSNANMFDVTMNSYTLKKGVFIYTPYRVAATHLELVSTHLLCKNTRCV